MLWHYADKSSFLEGGASPERGLAHAEGQPQGSEHIRSVFLRLRGIRVQATIDPPWAEAPTHLGQTPRLADRVVFHGDMPFSASSPSACGFFDRCVRFMPRNTFGALENWTLS